MCRHEHGKFFSIDLGGTNLRVMYVKIPRDRAAVVSALSKRQHRRGSGYVLRSCEGPHAGWLRHTSVLL